MSIINKIKKYFNKLNTFINNNKLLSTYVLVNVLETILLRVLTTKKVFTLYPLLADLGIIIIASSLSYLFKKTKNKHIYYQVLTIINTIVCIVHTIYYTFYTSFGSISELNAFGQTKNVTGSIVENLSLMQFIYLLAPITIYLVYRKQKKKNDIQETRIRQKKKLMKVLFTGLALLCLSFIPANGTTYSRLYKMWNRPYVVNRFGIILYQTMDIVNYTTSSVSTTFGEEEALNETIEYYKNNNDYKESNKYTDIFDGYNIVFVHMESIHSFLYDLSFNGEYALPTTRRLASEGMYFSNFYPQISTGTSSDTEFTILSSLMPSNGGIVFTHYYDRNYITTPKLLKQKGYYTFSMHGNDFTMWDRNKAHPSLGYDNFYYKDKYTYTEDEELNLGINDNAFFKQSLSYLEEIEKNNTNYMGTVITLSNHSPFIFLDKYAPYDLTKKYTIKNEETGKEEIVEYDYLTGTTIGNYIISSHNADLALGEFIDGINNSKYFNNTIFVFYGDHDPRLSMDQYNYFYNYDPITDELLKEDNPNYYDYNDANHLITKKTPLIIWSKNEKVRELINTEITYPMGMIDVMPTIGNMIGIENKYALGHDIFNIKENNIVAFPDSSFITNNYLYVSSKDIISPFEKGIEINESSIQYAKEYVDKIITISNDIIKHNLIDKIKEGTK